MGESPEYTTLVNMRQQLRIGFKKNLVNLATSFHREGLIDDTCYEEVSRARSFLTDTEKAEEIIRRVVDSVAISSKNYQRMLDILSLDSRFYRPLIDKLDEEYAKHVQKRSSIGAASQPKTLPKPSPVEPKHSPVWDKEITLSNLKSMNIMNYYDHKTCRIKELQIMADLAPDWSEIAVILEFKSSEIRAIQNPGSYKPAEYCLQDIISRWLQERSRQSKRYTGTWKGVYNLLVDSLHRNTAKELSDAIESEYSDIRGNLNSAPAEGDHLRQLDPMQQQSGLPAPSGKRKKLNKHQLADWLEEQGVEEDDVKILKERGVNEMLFLHLKEGDSYLERVSPVTKDLLEELQENLKKS